MGAGGCPLSGGWACVVWRAGLHRQSFSARATSKCRQRLRLGNIALEPLDCLAKFCRCVPCQQVKPNLPTECTHVSGMSGLLHQLSIATFATNSLFYEIIRTSAAKRWVSRRLFFKNCVIFLQAPAWVAMGCNVFRDCSNPIYTCEGNLLNCCKTCRTRTTKNQSCRSSITIKTFRGTEYPGAKGVSIAQGFQANNRYDAFANTRTSTRGSQLFCDILCWNIGSSSLIIQA